MKHPLRMMTHVEPVLELRQIRWQVLSGYVDMSAVNAALQLRPEAFNAVHMGRAFDVLASTVFNRAMVIALGIQRLVAVKLIGANIAASLYVFLNDRMQGIAAHVRHHFSHNLTAPFKHAKHGSLAEGSAASRAFPLAAYHRFVYFNMAGQSVVPIHGTHVLTNLVAHPPSALVSNADLPLQFLGRYSMSGRGEQVHGIEPFLQRRTGTMKGRANHRIDFFSTPRALISRVAADTMKLAVLAALRAIKLLAVSNAHKMIKACFVSIEAPKEILNCECRSHV